MTTKNSSVINNVRRVVFGLTLLFATLPFSGCGEKSPEKWNIVFILVDDLGWNQVNYHGFGFYETPNIDRIAADGIFFTDTYAAGPVCSPTRASIMTGKHPARLHLTDYIPGSPYPYQKLTTSKQAPCLPLEEITLAEMLESKGYVTGHFGKWHLSPDKNYEPGRPFDPRSQGFDEVFTSVKPDPDAPPDDAHHTIEITRRSLDFIDRYWQEPFFLYVSYHAVHRPLIEMPELVAKYEAKPGAGLPVNNPIMGAMIERMDKGIGQILGKIDEMGLREKTMVVFYSDNGGFEQLQDQAPLRGGKAMIFEGGIKVPFTIRWPGVVQPGSKSNVPVTSNDFFPTFANLVGWNESTAELDGKSLLPLLKGEGNIERDALFWHYPHYHHLGYKPASAIRMGDYKLIEWQEETFLGLDGQVELYNVREDVSETQDLSAQMPEKVEEMRRRVHEWRQAVGAQEMSVNPNYEPNRAELRFPESN